MTPSEDWAFGVTNRQELIWSETSVRSPAPHARTQSLSPQPAHSPCRRRLVQRLRVGTAAVNNPFYNLHRLGIFFTASPRFADLLLVTGPVTHAMREP